MSELEVKTQMAERLSQLLLLDPMNTVSAIRQLFMFNYDVAKHQVEAMPMNSDALLVNTLGLINGLFGDNEYRIVAVTGKHGGITCFEVVETDLTKVATVKQLQALQKKEVEDGTNALEDKE